MDGLSEHDARLLVRGGRRLEGEVVLSGAKNSALKLLAASLLTADPCVIRRVPRITDVGTMVTMLRALGAEVAGEDDALHVRAGAGLTGCAPYELVRTMRASIIVMGPLVARLGEATIAMPGGCNIGPRRIDFHIRGLAKLGARVVIDHGVLRVRSDGLRGAPVPLHYPSVGATDNRAMTATAADAAPRVAVVGPLLLFPDGAVQPSRRRFPTLATALVESTVLPRRFRRSAEHGRRPVGRLDDVRHHAQQRGLAAARGSDEDDELAVLDVEIQLRDDVGRTEGLVDVAELDGAHGGDSPEITSRRRRSGRGRAASARTSPCSGSARWRDWSGRCRTSAR